MGVTERMSPLRKVAVVEVLGRRRLVVVSSTRDAVGGGSGISRARESIWLVNMELRNGLPKRERIEAKRQIAEMEAALNALVKAEGAGR